MCFVCANISKILSLKLNGYCSQFVFFSQYIQHFSKVTRFKGGFSAAAFDTASNYIPKSYVNGIIPWQKVMSY